MKRLLFIALAFALCVGSYAKEKEPEVTDISVVCERAGQSGMQLLAVTCEAKKADKVTNAALINCAIRITLFRGYTSANGVTFKPLCPDPDVKNTRADYFNDFFNSNVPENYGEVIVDTRKVVKVGKMYRVTQNVNLNVGGLRKKLEKDGIIKALGSGW